jgi:membrane associated rhomboid family serine protease
MASSNSAIRRRFSDCVRKMCGAFRRAVTALTLHADVIHVTGNALAVAVLLPALVKQFGAG